MMTREKFTRRLLASQLPMVIAENTDQLRGRRNGEFSVDELYQFYLTHQQPTSLSALYAALKHLQNARQALSWVAPFLGDRLPDILENARTELLIATAKMSISSEQDLFSWESCFRLCWAQFSIRMIGRVSFDVGSEMFRYSFPARRVLSPNSFRRALRVDLRSCRKVLGVDPLARLKRKTRLAASL